MALFDGAAEKERKHSLEKLEDKRLRFAQSLESAGIKPKCTLYAQVEGGFHGIGVLDTGYVYLTGPGPNDADTDFTYQVHPTVRVVTEDVYIKPEGIGGLFGFGKKGGSGFNLILYFPDGTQGDLYLVAGQNCYYECERGSDPLFSVKRRRGNANFVWEFRTIEAGGLRERVQKWLALLGDQL